MPVQTTSSDFESRKRDLKTAWQRLDEANNEVIRTAKDDNGVILIDAQRKQAFDKNIGEMSQIKSEMDSLNAQIELKTWGSQAIGGSVAMAADAGNTTPAGPAGYTPSQYKTLGQLFTDSNEFKALQASGTGRMDIPFAIPGKDLGSRWEAKGGFGDVEQKDVYTTAPTGGPPLGFAPLYREDIVVQAFRKVRVRDLFPVQATTAAVIEYFRVTGFVASNAASVTYEWDTTSANFGIAPHTNLNFQGVQSPVRTINHWEAAHRNVLNDVPQLQGVIDTELLYGLRLAEDNQILNGTGTGDDLTGIMNFSGIQSYTGASPRSGANGTSNASNFNGYTTDTKVDDVRRAATKAILAYYEPTGVVANPLDWEQIETTKDSTGAYIIAIAVAMGAQQRIWRLPVVDTPAMTQGKALVGSFGLGAKLYDREEGTVRVAEQHADFFLRSAIVVLAEERIALTVPRPESFVAITFGP